MPPVCFGKHGLLLYNYFSYEMVDNKSKHCLLDLHTQKIYIYISHMYVTITLLFIHYYLYSYKMVDIKSNHLLLDLYKYIYIYIYISLMKMNNIIICLHTLFQKKVPLGSLFMGLTYMKKTTLIYSQMRFQLYQSHIMILVGLKSGKKSINWVSVGIFENLR